MLRLPPRPGKADAEVRAAFVAAGARSGAELDPRFGAMRLRFLQDKAGGTVTPGQVCLSAGDTLGDCSACGRRAEATLARSTNAEHGHSARCPKIPMSNSVRTCPVNLRWHAECAPAALVEAEWEHPAPVQGESSTTLRLTRVEAGTDGAGSCPLFVAGYDAWDDISLEYRFPWPVHLLLTPQVRRHRTFSA